MKYTTNLNLKKPDYTDPVDIEDINDNMDIVDTTLNNKADKTYVDNKVKTDVPLNAKFTDTVYVHPTTAGNKHIPTGGSIGQILKNTASGTATWQAESVTPIANNLTETIVGKALDATQGKILDDKIGILMPISGGDFTGISKAYINTSYTVAQIRNTILSTSDADVNSMQDGDIWIKYKQVM